MNKAITFSSFIDCKTQSAYVIWLTGISGSGKTTLGDLLSREFRSRGLPVEFLDGDIVRSFFENDLGYTRQERLLNIRRIAFAAKLLADHGVHVVVANIAPYYEARDFIRRKIPLYFQIFLDVSSEKVAERDVKGHYKKVREGKMADFIGCDDSYERPRNPDLRLETGSESVEESLGRIMEKLREKGILPK